MARSLFFKLKTKTGNDLEVFSDSGRPPYPPLFIASSRSDINSKLGANNERAHPDRFYNCHGLTLVSRLGWFDTDNNILSILRDNGFRLKASISDIRRDKISASSNIVAGDIVVYKEPSAGGLVITHTCTIYEVRRHTRQGIISVDLRVLSKLGEMGEYFHEINNKYIMSIYGSIIEVWSNSV